MSKPHFIAIESADMMFLGRGGCGCFQRSSVEINVFVVKQKLRVKAKMQK